MHLKQEWGVVKQAPLACMICALIGAAVTAMFYAERMSVISERAALWKDKSGQPTVLTLSSKPNFHLTALGADIFVPDFDKSVTGIALSVQIRNSGVASIATDWKLKVAPGGMKSFTVQNAAIPNELRLTGTPNTTLKATESLAERVMKEPLQAGGVPVQGRVLFYVRLPRDLVLEDLTMFRLSVQDLGGVEFSTEQRVGDWLRLSSGLR